MSIIRRTVKELQTSRSAVWESLEEKFDDERCPQRRNGGLRAARGKRSSLPPAFTHAIFISTRERVEYNGFRSPLPVITSRAEMLQKIERNEFDYRI